MAGGGTSTPTQQAHSMVSVNLFVNSQQVNGTENSLLNHSDTLAFPPVSAP